MSEPPARNCNGGPHGAAWCGAPATVVCTERAGFPFPMQWYACDDPAHQEGGSTESIAEWFERIRGGAS
jgi:hypothetical protein